ncbi:restriction endonuclease subunit S [Aeromonas hydrophila]|uniref:restriction endonuclease subunit S n=1 Tax=Aeromonas hydrophila TaxID=644 RepID=UPI0022A0D386|nr:restriction endonuclease subunit S [Aeromonas hydrophila]HCT5131810.1 restriction endonuclease subunit S [Aeromonas hydrophila]
MAEQIMQNAVGKTIPAGYKQTEVGVIPKDWVVSSIGEVGELTSSKRIFESDYVTDGIPFYRGQEISALIEGKEMKNVCFISKSRFHQLAVRYGAPQRGDILITAVGTLGNSFLVNVDEPFYFKDGNLIWLRNISGVFPGYLIRQLHFHKNEIVDNAIGSSQKALTIVVLKDFKFPLPINKQEQTAIANVLSDSDALIDVLEQLIAKKQAVKSATMQQLLTGRTRLPAFALRPDGTKKGYKPSELGEIPEDWEVCEMGSLGFTYGGLTGKSKKDFGHGNGLYVPFTNVMANIIVDIAKLEKVHVAENQNDVINGDLLFNGSSETPEEVCFCSLVNNDVSGLYLNSFCFGFRRKDGAQYIPIYLSYWFRSSIGRKAVSIMAQGSTRYNISKKQFLKLSITLPSIEEQTAIATILSDMDNELQALTQKLDKARALKQGMMQQLLTGKIRLPLTAGA